MTFHLIKTEINLLAIIKNLEDFIELEKENRSLIKDENILIITIGITFFDLEHQNLLSLNI